MSVPPVNSGESAASKFQVGQKIRINPYYGHFPHWYYDRKSSGVVLGVSKKYPDSYYIMWEGHSMEYRPMHHRRELLPKPGFWEELKCVWLSLFRRG